MLINQTTYKRAAYKCANASTPHGLTLHFDQMPPENCPVCNAAVGRVPMHKLQGSTPIRTNPEPAKPYTD